MFAIWLLALVICLLKGIALHPLFWLLGVVVWVLDS